MPTARVLLEHIDQGWLVCVDEYYHGNLVPRFDHGHHYRLDLRLDSLLCGLEVANEESLESVSLCCSRTGHYC